MSITEDEAKTKWCPMARVILDYSVQPDTQAVASANRGEADETDQIFTGSRCIGSGCMMWRSEVGPASRRATGRGFCGLAGVPS